MQDGDLGQARPRSGVNVSGPTGQSAGAPVPLRTTVAGGRFPRRSGSGQERARGFEVGLAHEDLARAGSDEVLEGRVDRLGVAVRAVDPVALQQSAHDLGLSFAGDDREDDAFAGLHGESLAGRDRRAELVDSSGDLTRRLELAVVTDAGDDLERGTG